MVPLHRFNEELPGRLIRRLVRAHQAFALPRQLRRCCPMDIDAKALAEAADARAIGSVDPHGTARRVGADLVRQFRVHHGFILAGCLTVHWLPWQVVAFLALLASIGARVWSPRHWHAAVRANAIGRRALPFGFIVLTVLVYGSMLI